MTTASSSKILILGCSTKAGMYVAKQFHKAGHRVYIYDWTNQPNKSSRFVSDYFSVASPEKNLLIFCEELLNFLSNNHFDALLPLHDASLEIMQLLKEKIPASIKILGLNDKPVYKYAHNKWELLCLAKEYNIPVPKSIYVADLTQIPSSLPFAFPCIVKPVSSALIKDDRLYTFKVSVVKDQLELEDRIREVILNIPVMVQEFIEGYGIGFNFLAKDGELLNSYIHKRISENEGVSSYREMLNSSIYNNKEIVESFIKKMNWTGVGMIEFKVSDNVPVLMELNGRFFGSIELSVKSGLNFPLQFLEMYLYNKLPVKNQAFIQHTKVRNLHDELFLNVYQLFKGKIIAFIKWKAGLIKSLFSPHDYIEDNFFTDPGFVSVLYMADIKRIFTSYREKKKRKKLGIAPFVWKTSPNTPLSIAFICKGNICRSPFAELYARSINHFHRFSSYGSITQENRLSPLHALKASTIYNIELADHRSKYLSTDAISNTDIFVVMDKINFFDLLNLGIPESKIKFLSEAEIQDPYKKNYDYFVATYSTIKEHLDQILKHEKIS